MGVVMFADVLHFSFTVSDIDRSIAWYTDVLGLEFVHRQRGDNAYTRTLVGMTDAVIEAAQFRIPGVRPGLSTHMLELVQYLAPRGRGLRELPTNDVGTAHLAFLVTDARAEYERLRSRGVQFRNQPVAITEGANAGGYACYFHDPDGITLELLEPSPERKRVLGLTL
jgi:catechol 2,3-dioxygenase-like lactoylglutathione lyase family enzyme